MSDDPDIAGGSIHEDLLRRWMDLAGADAYQAGRALIACYDQPHRVYHDARHLWDCLGLLWRLKDMAFDFRAVALALWFHDAVYEIGAADNEARSAAMAREVLTDLGLGATQVKAVEFLVRATDHAAAPMLADAQLICDIDLSVLARPPQEYRDYADAIRAEARLPDDQFNARRAELLSQMLSRPHVFHTETFRAQFEASAQANMAAELKDLA